MRRVKSSREFSLIFQFLLGSTWVLGMDSAFLEKALAQNKNQTVQNSRSSSIKSEMLVKVKSCSMQEEINASAMVEAKVFAELRSKWTTYIEKIAVSEKSQVRKGDLIALTETKSLTQELEWLERYYRSNEVSMLRQQKDFEQAEKRKANIKILVDKGINPASELESLEQSLSSMKNGLESSKDRLKNLQERMAETKERIKNASFYAPIDGVVVKLIADPKSLLGRVEAGYDALVARIEKPGSYIAKPVFLDIQAQKLKEGMKASVVLPDGSSYEGKLSYLSPVAVKPGSQNSEDDFGNAREEEKQTKLPSFIGHIEFERVGEILPSSLLAKVKIFLGSNSVKQCVPWNAIRNQDGVNFVDVYRESKGWEKKTVKLGRRSSYEVEIVESLPSDSFVNARLN